MNILNSLTWRSLKLNRRRTIVTIIGIILSAAMICATITIAVSFQDYFIRRARQTDGDFHATFYRVAPEQVKYLTEHIYTEKAMLSRNAGFALFEESTSAERPYFLLKEYDHTALRHMPISLTAGRYPEKAGEILLSEEAIRKGGQAYRIGDTITLDLGERLDPEGMPLPEGSPYDDPEQFATTSTRTYTITGFIAKPHFEHFSSAPGFTAVSFLERPASGAAEAVNVSILGKKPRQLYDQIPAMAEAAGNVEYVYNNELLKFLGISKNERAINALNTVAGIIILLIIVGSVTVIYNAFAISVSERKKQFGLLASTGATPGQIRRSVFFEGLILGLIGIPLGVLSGIGGIGVTLSAVNQLLGEFIYGSDLVLRAVISPGMVPLTAAFVALIIFISAYLPSNRAAAISPIEAIRQSADIKISGKTVKTSPLTRRIFGLEGELALKNLKRHRRRYRTTVFSLFISIVLFVSFSTFINYALTGGGMYYQEFNFDFSVMVDSLTSEKQTDLGAQVAALDGVERCTIQRTILTDAWLPPESFSTYFQKNFIDEDRLPADEEGRYHLYFHLTALGEKEFETFAEKEGLEVKLFQDRANPRAILINNSRTHDERLTEYKPLRAAKGDRLELSGMIDQGEEQETAAPTITMELGAVTENLPLGIQPADLGWVDLLVSDTLFEATRSLIEEQGGITSYASGDTLQLFLITDESADLGEQLRTICEQYTDDRLYIQDVKAIQREMKQTSTAVSIFLYGFITLITLIGVTNIFNTISTNVALRRREFAMLKSVGLTPGGFNKMINYESIFYGLKALLYGLPVSILISLGLYNGFGNVFGFAFFLPIKEILICIAGVFVIVFITMLHAGSKLKHDNIIDALKEENL